MDIDIIGAELAKPLDKRHVQPQRANGPKGDYVTAWHSIAEANRIFGWNGWTRETVEMICVAEREREIGQNNSPGWGVSYRAKVRITAGFLIGFDTCSNTPFPLIREGSGNGHGIDRDLGQAHESAVKEAESDAMKRALMTFGWPFGLALYDKSRENVSNDPDAGERHEAMIERELGKIATINHLDELRGFWEGLLMENLAAYQDKRIIAAKNARKSELQEGGTE